jgi:hypothetical protein
LSVSFVLSDCCSCLLKIKLSFVSLVEKNKSCVLQLIFILTCFLLFPFLPGADISVDVAYNWLRFFLEDDERLKEIGEKGWKEKEGGGGLTSKMGRSVRSRRAQVL